MQEFWKVWELFASHDVRLKVEYVRIGGDYSYKDPDRSIRRDQVPF